MLTITLENTPIENLNPLEVSALERGVPLVELDWWEQRAHEKFNRLLDEGLGIEAAVTKVRNGFGGGMLSDEFLAWLAF